jgi:hypothetical protein
VSAYKQEATMRHRGRSRKQQPPRVIPHAIMKSPDHESSPGEGARKFATNLRANNGVAIKALGTLLNPEPPFRFERIDAVTELTYKDGSIPFLEVRISKQNPSGYVSTSSPNLNPNLLAFPENPNKTNKEYKHIYLGDKIWPLDPETGNERTDRNAFCNTTSALFQTGLFIPTNAPAALELLRRYRGDLDEYNRRLSAFQAAQQPTYEPTDTPATFPEQRPPTPVFIWTEGEKSRKGVESYINNDDPAIQLLLEEYNVEIVTLGVLAGAPGAANTNYTLRPYSNDFIIKGVNDEFLELPLALHIYARDNDDDGRTEANITAQCLVKLGVPADQVRIASPPVNALPKWDDGDQLPPGVSAYDRLKQILDAPSTIGQYVFRAKGKNQEEVDPTNRNNKRLAIQRISTAIFDETSTGERHFVISKTGETLSASDYMYMAELCLEEMGHQPTDNLLHEGDWKPVFVSRFPHPIESRNFIYEEVMQTIERGQFELANAPDKEIYNPETYLLDGFGLPDTIRNRLISKVIIRDFVAVTLRAHLDKGPVIPQMLPILHADEGVGKSEFCKVLAGGTPGPESFHSRYSNNIDIGDLKSLTDRGQAAFANKAKCKTILEFQDKALGDTITIAQNGLLNDMANMSQVQFREPYKVYTSFPRQFIIIFTTNREDLIGHNMGRRRWIIVDLNQSMKGFAKRASELQKRKLDPNSAPLTTEEELIAQGHNPGILKNFQRRAGTLAYMYNSGEWRGSLTVPPELTQDLEDERDKFTSTQNWELVLQEELLREPHDEEEGVLATEKRMVLSTSLYAAVKERTGREPPDANFGKLMKSLGYKNYKIHKKNARGWSKAKVVEDIVEFSRFKPAAHGSSGHWYFCIDPLDVSGVRPPRKEIDPNVFK